MFLSGLVMKVAILNKKLFKTWQKSIWHRRRQNEKEMAQTVSSIYGFAQAKVKNCIQFENSRARRRSILNILANCPEFSLLMSSKPFTGTPIITVHQGKEPITFTGFFLGWDDEFWDTDVSDKLQYS